MLKVAIPWWKSKVIVGGGISVLATMLKATGLIGDVGDETLAQVTDAVLTLIAAGGALTAVGSRVTQKEAPVIVGSNAGAELIKDASAIIAQAQEPEVIAEIVGQQLEVPSWMTR